MRPLLVLFVILTGCVSVAERLPPIQEQQIVSQDEAEHLKKCVEFFYLETQLLKRWITFPNQPSEDRIRLAHALATADQVGKECQPTTDGDK